MRKSGFFLAALALAFMVSVIGFAQSDPALTDGTQAVQSIENVVPPAPTKLDGGTLVMLFSFALSWLTVPVTSVLRKAFKTSGNVTLWVNIVLNAVLTAGTPWILGAYPKDFIGGLIAFGVAFAKILFDKISHTLVQGQAST